jgi:poly(3-hydroxybutyrate) depolymerase
VGQGQGQVGSTSYNYYVPACAVERAPSPAVYWFHGTNQPASHVVRVWGNVPEQHCFLLFALQSVDPSGWGLANGSLDLRNLTALETLTDAQYNIDRARRYLTGVSAGGHLTHWLGLIRTGYYSGLIPCSGSLGAAQKDGNYPPPADARSIPVYIIHGMRDTTVPFSFAEYTAEAYRRLGWPLATDFDPNRGHGCPASTYSNGYLFVHQNTPKNPG